MKDNLLALIHQANPWLNDLHQPIIWDSYIPRLQAGKLLLPEWDGLWLVLVGPRQAGKTTLAKYLSQELLRQKRFENLL